MSRKSLAIFRLLIIISSFCLAFSISCRTVDDDDEVNTIINTSITDTIYVDRMVHDTTYIDSIVHDTTFLDSIVHDTAYIDSIIHDTIYVDSIIRDTIFVDTLIHDTIIVDRECYHNPIIGIDAPDPSVIKAEDEYFYLYSTARNVNIYKSRDLIKWDYVTTAFEEKGRPQIVKNASIWAPDINYINGQYVLYYAQSVWGGKKSCGIGVAISDNPEGPFTDLGKLFTSMEINVLNSIDPFYIEDDGKKYLFWGSFNGIYGIRLSDDGLSLYPGSNKFQIAGNAIEGTYIHKRNGYYYLFGSKGRCCEGLKSTYHVVVGRSSHLEGPYTNKAGFSLMSSSGNTFLKSNNIFVAPGHNSEILTDDAGNDWIIYHGYLKSDEAAGRVVFLDQVKWKENWPYIENTSPSEKYYSPAFIND